MFFILSKILTFLVNPMFWIVGFLLLALTTKKKTQRKKLLVCSLVFCLFFSNGFIYNEFALVWENQVPSQVDLNENYDVAIIMGGIMNQNPESKQFTFNANAERITNVLPLYFSGRVNKILIAGGSGSLVSNTKEAALVKDFLIQLKVKEEDILTDEDSRNTHENALFATKILQKEKLNTILLSTSAVHMPRSLACFHKLGVHPTPFPVDYTSYKRDRYKLVSIFIPNASTINAWNWLIHEWLGMLTYKMMGYC